MRKIISIFTQAFWNNLEAQLYGDRLPHKAPPHLLQKYEKEHLERP
jgi:hypothetical protein